MRRRRVVGRIYGKKYSWKGHQERNRHKNRIKRSGQARLVYVKNKNRNIPTTWRWARGDYWSRRQWLWVDRHQPCPENTLKMKKKKGSFFSMQSSRDTVVLSHIHHRLSSTVFLLGYVISKHLTFSRRIALCGTIGNFSFPTTSATGGR